MEKMVIFFRKEGFYPVHLSPECKIEDHVKLNPGTTRVEDINGNVLWPTRKLDS
jgi:hypothetical protein